MAAAHRIVGPKGIPAGVAERWSVQRFHELVRGEVKKWMAVVAKGIFGRRSEGV